MSDLDRARRRRQQLEGQRLGWLPKRHEQLDGARRDETAATAAVYRAHVEREHGALPFAGLDTDAADADVRALHGGRVLALVTTDAVSAAQAAELVDTAAA